MIVIGNQLEQLQPLLQMPSENIQTMLRNEWYALRLSYCWLNLAYYLRCAGRGAASLRSECPIIQVQGVCVRHWVCLWFPLHVIGRVNARVGRRGKSEGSSDAMCGLSVGESAGRNRRVRLSMGKQVNVCVRYGCLSENFLHTQRKNFWMVFLYMIVIALR